MSFKVKGLLISHPDFPESAVLTRGFKKKYFQGDGKYRIRIAKRGVKLNVHHKYGMTWIKDSEDDDALVCRGPFEELFGKVKTGETIFKVTKL